MNDAFNILNENITPVLQKGDSAKTVHAVNGLSKSRAKPNEDSDIRPGSDSIPFSAAFNSIVKILTVKNVDKEGRAKFRFLDGEILKIVKETGLESKFRSILPGRGKPVSPVVPPAPPTGGQPPPGNEINKIHPGNNHQLRSASKQNVKIGYEFGKKQDLKFLSRSGIKDDSSISSDLPRPKKVISPFPGDNKIFAAKSKTISHQHKDERAVLKFEGFQFRSPGIRGIKPVIDPGIYKIDWIRFPALEKFDSSKERIVDIRTKNRAIKLAPAKNNAGSNIYNPKERSHEKPGISPIRKPYNPGGKSPNNTKARADRFKSSPRKSAGVIQNSNRVLKTADRQKVSKNVNPKGKFTKPVLVNGFTNHASGAIKMNIPRNKVRSTLTREITNSIMNLVDNHKSLNGKTIALKLYPPELGNMNLRFTEINNVIRIKIHVESDDAFRMIHGGANEVKHALISAGVSIDSIDVAQGGKFNDMVFNHYDDSGNGSAFNRGNSNESNPHQPENMMNLKIRTKENIQDMNYISRNGVNCLA